MPPNSNIVRDVFDAEFLAEVDVDDFVVEGMEDVEEEYKEEEQIHPKIPTKELYQNEHSEKAAVLFLITIGMVELPLQQFDPRFKKLLKIKT